MVLDDLHTLLRRTQRVRARGAPVHRAAPRRQRPDGGRPHRRPQRREPGVHEQQAAAAGGRRQDRWAASCDSATRRADRRVLPARGTPVRRATRSTTRTTRSAASTRASTLDDAQERRRLVRRRARPPQDDPLRQRGDRLRHQRRHSQQPHRAPPSIIDDTRDAIARGDARRTSASTASIPRGLTDARRRDDRASAAWPYPDDHRRSASASSSLQNELRLSQDSLRTLVGRDRRLRRRQPQRLRDRVRSHRPRQQLVLRAGVLPADRQARRQVPQDRGARHAARADRPRRAAGYVAPTGQGARRRRSRRRTAAVARAARRAATARCRSAA